MLARLFSAAAVALLLSIGAPALSQSNNPVLLDVDQVDPLVAPYAIAGRSLDPFRGPCKQVIVAPDACKTGLVRPYQQARN